jgi:thiopurine S-methyltransferase
MGNTKESTYWNEKYSQNQTGWDIGYASTPIMEYINQLEDKNLKILIPGAGRGWEVEYIFKQGFKNIYYLDFADLSSKEFKKRCPDFPDSQIIIDDFFNHKGKYDLIIEQTFFSSLQKFQRTKYAEKIFNLLNNKGKLAGLLFDVNFPFQGPPFGGSYEEYKTLFEGMFDFIHFEKSYNSINPRLGNEIFMVLQKKSIVNL